MRRRDDVANLTCSQRRGQRVLEPRALHRCACVRRRNCVHQLDLTSNQRMAHSTNLPQSRLSQRLRARLSEILARRRLWPRATRLHLRKTGVGNATRVGWTPQRPAARDQPNLTTDRKKCAKRISMCFRAFLFSSTRAEKDFADRRRKVSDLLCLSARSREQRCCGVTW